MSRLCHVAGALALLVAFGCGGGDAGGTESKEWTSRTEHATGGKSWTVLVYMVADNDLEPFALDDLTEMLDVGSGAGLNIVVQADRAVSYASGGIANLPDWTTAKRFIVMPDAFAQASDLGELQMGEPAVLADFVEWGVKTYPADKYALFFWDHGSGWTGFAADFSSPTYDGLSLNELRTGMETGLKRAGLDGFDLLGFDACLMGSIETALALRPYGEYLVASEELEPGHGWDWRALLAARANPSIDPVALGKAIIDGFQQQSKDEGTVDETTLSLVDLYKLNGIEDAARALTASLKSQSSGAATLFARAMTQSTEFGASGQTINAAHLLDLNDFASKVTQLADASSGLESGAATLGDSVRKGSGAVVHYYGGAARAAASGLSGYMPRFQALYDPAYDEVEGIDAWRDLLHAYFATAQAKPAPPQFVNAGGNANVVSSGGNLVFGGTVTPDSAPNLVDALLYYGITTSDYLFFFGDIHGAYEDTLVLAQWAKRGLQITQGSHTAYAYYHEELSNDGKAAITIPFDYKASSSAASQSASLVYAFDASGDFVSATFYLYSEAGTGELTPAVGSLFYPLVIALDTDGNFSWIRTDDQAFDGGTAGSMSLSNEPLSTASADLGAVAVLYAIDFANQSDSVFWTGEL